VEETTNKYEPSVVLEDKIYFETYYKRWLVHECKTLTWNFELVT
jgi:hypothetical protein